MHLENVDATQFRRILDEKQGERCIAEYLRTNPWILYWTLCPASGHARYLFSEFPLADQYRVDVVILNSYSGAWEVYFIELEPVDDPVFTKGGTPSKRLAGAIRQVDDWAQFVEQNPDVLRRSLVRWAIDRDRLGYSSGREPSNYSGDRLADPRTVVFYKYCVVIGRSSMQTPEGRLLAGRHGGNHRAKVVSYDRLLHLAEHRYGGNASSSSGTTGEN